MVIIDRLQISDDGKTMYIFTHVPSIPDCENLYIKSVTIQTADQVSEIAPEMVSDDYIYKYTVEDGTDIKTLELAVSINDTLYNKVSFSEDLFFVSIKTEGTPGPCLPCTLDEETTVGVTFDENLLYQKVMDFTKSLQKECTAPNKNFVDFILLWNAFKASVETEHYVSAKNFYKMLFDSAKTVNITGKCGCNGRNIV